MGSARVFLSLSVLLFATGLARGLESYTLAVEEWPPYSYLEEGRAVGTDIELLDAAAAKAGLRFDYLFLPWARAIEMVRRGEADGILSLYDLPERRVFLEYPEEPLSEETIVLIAAASRTDLREIRSLGDLDGLTVATQRETSYGPDFDAARGFAREMSNDSKMSVRMLLAGGRVDLAVINRYNLLAMERETPGLAEKLRLMPFIVHSQRLYVAFSKAALAGRPSPVAAVTASLRQLRSDGTAARIFRKYLGTEFR